MTKTLCLILFISIFSCKTEKNKTKSDNDKIEFSKDVLIQPIEYKAEFKFGTDSIMKIIYSNMNLTMEKGKVFISIKIDNKGNAGEMKIVKSENEKLNSEALRLVELIPNEWKPAELGSERTKISSTLFIPINFNEQAKTKYSR